VALALVAIVGAPNVGKSTLFNRLVGRRQAIVTDQPGVTRDRLYGTVEDAPCPFRLVDTGGLTPSSAEPMTRAIESQAAQALEEAALVLFVVDARAGASSVDREVGEMLRRRGASLILVANKVDSPKNEPAAQQLYELGLGDPLPVSAEHGRGLDELLACIADRLVERAPEEPAGGEAERPLRVAIVGRPNVGKSSLLNRLVGAERVLVSELPGTTRDAVDTLLEIDQRRYVLIDTAGIRRGGRVREQVERFSIVRARQNIERCDAAVLVLDAAAGLIAQDTHIAGYVQEAYKPLVVAVNKWDLVGEREEEAKRWEETIRDRLRFAKQVPLVLISAKTGQRALAVLDRVDGLYRLGAIRVPTVELNRWLQQVAPAESSGSAPAGAARLYYATQTGTHPPRFVLFCNDPRRLHFSFRRYLANTLRERFGFGASPIRLEFRGRSRGPGR
jgi:GTP-binding protein